MPLYSVVRKDINGHYEPGNLEWVTWDEMLARRRTTAGGEPISTTDYTVCGEDGCTFAGTWAQFDRHWDRKHAPKRARTA